MSGATAVEVPRAAQAAWRPVAADDLRPETLRGVVGFLSRYVPAGTDPLWSEASLRWKLGTANPAGSGFLTLALAGEGIVGVTSVTRKRLWIDGCEVPGAEIGDTYTHPDYLKPSSVRGHPSEAEPVEGVDPEYLRRSVFGRLVTETRLRAQRAGVQVIYGTPNAYSRAGYEKRLNFRAHRSANHTLIRPSARALLARWPALRRLAPLLRGAEAALTSLAASAAWRPGWRIGVMDRPTEAFDALWQRVRHQRRFGLVRDRAYFQHRFIDHPIARYGLHGAYRGSDLLGVLVTRRHVTTWGKRYCSLADWLVDRSVPGLFWRLLAHVLGAQERGELDGFHGWVESPRSPRRSLRMLGFVPVSRSPVIFLRNPDGRMVLETCPELDFTLACSDNV